MNNIVKRKNKIEVKLIENRTYGHVNMAFENNTDKTIKEKRMKYGCYHKINNTAYCYETAFKIAVILGKLPVYNNMFKEQVDTSKNMQNAHSKIINEGYVLKPRLRAKANEFSSNALVDNKLIIENKEKKEDN